MDNCCELERHDSLNKLRLKGVWRLARLSALCRTLGAQQFAAETKLILDGGSLEEIDTSSALVLLQHLYDAGYQREQIVMERFSPAHQSVIDLAFSCARPGIGLKPNSPPGFLGNLGRGAQASLATVLSLVSFIGSTTAEFIRALMSPALLRLKELVVQLEVSGMNAVPIVVLVTFLIGVVTAYLAGVQMERYGANVFVVDGVALAMCRELSPILVAIIVAGRSGSAFTAQIGAMKLNEEIDAMVTLGLSPMRVLVVPRMLALMIAMPILVFVGDVAGILGGMLVAYSHLGVTAATFVDRLRAVLWVKSVMVGLVKGPVFGLFVATIGCRMGLIVENNARSVGINTTATVVYSIVAVILLNAAFAVVLTELRI